MTEIQILVFVIASFFVIITPGQDMILVMSRSIVQGSKAGIATAAGVSIGLVGHTILAAFGLGAILRTSETWFTIFKLIGAAYLLYLGLKLLRTKQTDFDLQSLTVASTPALFLQGAISNISNPKIAIFYFAYLPQFVPIRTSQPGIILFSLGLVFALLTFVIKAPIGYGAGTLSGWLRAHPTVQVWINRVSGGVLVGLGLRLAFERKS